MPRQTYDLIVIGAGPAGTAAAIHAARGGATVKVFEKASHGRDKSCGDGLTPRAVTALNKLGIPIEDAHYISGLRMIAGDKRRELLWPSTQRFASHGAVWPRRELDKRLADTAEKSGATVVWNTEAVPSFNDANTVVGVRANGEHHKSKVVALSTGAPGKAARMLGIRRDPNEPFGLAIRAYAASPRHDDKYLEACLTLRSQAGHTVPGYGWIFPTGNGTVNIGVGALSTMKNFRKLNLNNLLETYRQLVAKEWSLGVYQEKPKAWRLPMSSTVRHGTGWAAIGDAAGLINPMNGEGIDYALESGMLLAERLLADPDTATISYDRIIGQRFDKFLRCGRRFSFLIGHPLILRNGLRISVGTQAAAEITLKVMGNLIDDETPGVAGTVLQVADRMLSWSDPILRRTRPA